MRIICFREHFNKANVIPLILVRTKKNKNIKKKCGESSGCIKSKTKKDRTKAPISTSDISSMPQSLCVCPSLRIFSFCFNYSILPARCPSDPLLKPRSDHSVQTALVGVIYWVTSSCRVEHPPLYLSKVLDITELGQAGGGLQRG